MEKRLLKMRELMNYQRLAQQLLNIGRQLIGVREPKTYLPELLVVQRLAVSGIPVSRNATLDFPLSLARRIVRHAMAPTKLDFNKRWRYHS
jgi:hypothetical protein